jgi:hypothetical protein
MAIVAIGIETLMICPLISTTEKRRAGGTTPPARQGYGHAVPVKRSSGGTRNTFNGPVIRSEFFKTINPHLPPVPSPHGIL